MAWRGRLDDGERIRTPQLLVDVLQAHEIAANVLGTFPALGGVMKTLIASLLFAVLVSGAACSHHGAQPATPTTGSNAEAATDPDIDPTLPSWAPASCKGYHTNVVKLAACTDIGQDVRDKVAAKYDADNKSWQGLTNAQQSDLDQVKASCSDQAASVKAQMTGHCSAAN